MDAIDRLAWLDKWLVRVLEGILVAFFAVFLVLVCILVVLRYVFASTILGGNEFVTIAFLVTSAIGGALCISRREHIAITFFIDLLPLNPKKLIYIAGLVLMAIVNVYMVYYSIGWIEKAGHNPWEPLGWPQGIVHAVIPFSCSLAVLFCVLKIVFTLAGRESVETVWMPED
ncbi:MAG: TRAP transporter small permease subunit [Rhodobacteraceae bacterium]|nr:TRAP transporter small permease subunit [Paracoccaceae bacterium]